MSVHIPRREFIAALGGAAAVGWPLAPIAQQQLPIVGLLGPGSQATDAFRITAFRQGLKEVGHVEGQTVSIEYRGAEGHYDRFPSLLADLLRRHVSVIATGSTPAAQAAKAIAATVPIVFTLAADPVELHLVASLNRPGSNFTGVTVLGVELGSKRLELLHELIPTATIIALLVNPTNPSLAETITRDAQTGARMLGLHLHVLHASTAGEIDEAFAMLRQVRASGLVLSSDTFFTSQLEQFVALARRDAVPTIYHTREFPAAGGLMSYATDFSEAWRQAGIYTGRILKGERAADLPVQEVTKIDFVINLKTATALGLAIPRTLLARANELIE